MRRGFSIFLIVLFGLGPLSVMLAGSSDAALPACCRRQGTHHCAMAVQAAAMGRIDQQPSFTAPATCPSYPGPALAILVPMHALTSAAGCAYIAAMRKPVPDLERKSAYATPGRSHAGRGPPTTSLS